MQGGDLLPPKGHGVSEPRLPSPWGPGRSQKLEIETMITSLGGYISVAGSLPTAFPSHGFKKVH